jgi:cell division protease FtsH
VLAATNRADILDSALTRPGRFDRKVQVSLPDINGRKAIFDVHFRDKKLASEIDMEELALLTGGFSGADIANLANEAAILSVRYNETEINQKCLTNAYEKITIGLPSAFENREKDILKLVAYHESGHAITVGLFKEFFDVRKVTITSNKGGAGGYTLFTPKEKFNSYPTKKFMLANMIVALGGRAAETVLYSNINSVPINYKNINLFENFDDLDITTGASNDLKQANNIARQYVSLFGLGENIGIYDTTSTNTQSPFLGRDIAMGSSDKLSEYTKSQIDKEIEKLIGFAFQKAIDILNANKNILFDMSEQLLNQKTINSKEFNEYKITYY